MPWMARLIPPNQYIYHPFMFYICNLLCDFMMTFSYTISGLPVTIRLLDPPLHEFLPEGNVDQIVGELTAATGMTNDEVTSRIEKLSEVNPMLGFRGCRYILLILNCYNF